MCSLSSVWTLSTPAYRQTRRGVERAETPDDRETQMHPSMLTPLNTQLAFTLTCATKGTKSLLVVPPELRHRRPV